jgi:disease resistance protein RPM1
MEFATGPLGTLLPKLGQLLQDEYNMQAGAKKNIKFLTRELESMHAALHNVGDVPREQLSELVRIWASDVREVSYDMEDISSTPSWCVSRALRNPAKVAPKGLLRG